MGNTTSFPPVRRRARVSGAALACGAVLAVCLAPAQALAHTAPAKPVTLHGGTVSLVFGSSTFSALTKSTTGVFASTHTATPVSPATSHGSTFRFPIGSGKLNLSKLTGKASTRGGIDLTNTQTAPLFGTTTTQADMMSLRFNLGGSSLLVLNFVGASTTPNVPFATLVTKKAKHGKHGHAVTISGITVKLTSAGAQLLNDFASGFKAGQTVGTATIAGKS